MFSHDTPWVWPLLTLRAWLAGFIKKTTIYIYIVVTHKICKLSSLWLRRRFFFVFPIELSVAMETRPGQKPNATFPHPDDDSDLI